MAKQDDFSRYTIRVPRPLYSAIEQAASAANRSVNSEIVERLNASVLAEEPDAREMAKRVESLTKELKDTQIMNALVGRMIGKSDDELNKHLVISKSFCLAIMRLSEEISAEIFHFAQEMLDVYDMEHEAIVESERIAKLRQIVDVPAEDLATFDREAYFDKQLRLRESK